MTSEITDEHDGLAIARHRIAEEARVKSGFLDLGMLGLDELPAELFALSHLRNLNLGTKYLAETGNWANVPLSIAPNRLDSQLVRLSAFVDLVMLSVSGARLPNLIDIEQLKALHYIDCSRTQVSDLSPVSGLNALQSLNCSGTQVSDLSPVSGLSALQSLDCSRTPVSDLSPLRGLSALQWLSCWETPVSDLSPVSGLSALQSLNCAQTPVSDLSPLSGLSALQSLDCSDTRVSDLSPVSGLSTLETLHCSRCFLATIPEDFCHKPSLDTLYLFEAQVPGVPVEVLSQNKYDNCLHSLRAHLGDLSAGAVTVADIKLMVLGNGRVGKTQICRRLRGEDYDPRVPSTHGVFVTSASFPASDGASPSVLHIWDFGGQDIYHGTHALFVRTRAAFLIVWTAEAESSGEHAYDGMRFPFPIGSIPCGTSRSGQPRVDSADALRSSRE